MKSKKFVLAGLALLAITGLLALAGCKNDSVPEPTRYTVKFETAHGTAPVDITVVSGTKLTAEQLKGLADTADYIFEGWYDGETKAEGGTYTVTKDVTLEAKWKPRDQVQISFKVSGNTVELSSEPAGAAIHYTTNGTDPKTSETRQEGNSVSITQQTTIKAYAEKLGELKPSDVVEKTYLVVTFNTDGGSTVASQTVESGQKAKEPAEPELEGSWFLDWYSDEGLAKKFDFNTPITTATTVYAKWSYKLHTEPSILTNYTSPNHTDSKWKYVEFGDWPQTIKDASVSVDETKSKEMGMFTYYLGSDDNHYVKQSDSYYRVEPIVWRVLTEDFKAPDGDSTGKDLLLAESILIGDIPYYVDYSDRTIGNQTVYANNWQYSTIRAWLNGSYEADDTQDKTYEGKGFLQTAFTMSAQNLIAETTVDNSEESTFDTGDTPKTNQYVCVATTDKIFLLSRKEVTDSGYGFVEYPVASGTDSVSPSRTRVMTDYAKAAGASHISGGDCGAWWLRSPDYYLDFHVCYIDSQGPAHYRTFSSARGMGIVPALSISL